MRAISTRELFANVSYVALNPGEGFGVLTAVDPTAARPPTIRDVALFPTLPNDLGHVAGVISATPQTPLSHINLKAKQNDTPNAYVRDAAAHPRIAPLLGQVVRYEVGPEDFALAPADARGGRGLAGAHPPDAAADAAARPRARRRSSTSTTSATRDVQRVGAKAANVAELRRMLPAGVAPDGYAIPFFFYDALHARRAASTTTRARSSAIRRCAADPARREEALDKLRKKMKKADLPAELGGADRRSCRRASSRARRSAAARRRTTRTSRASTAPACTTRITHRPDEGDLSKTVKQVWASLWNFRAFDEREFHRIDHWRRRWACSCTRTSTTSWPTASR